MDGGGSVFRDESADGTAERSRLADRPSVFELRRERFESRPEWYSGVTQREPDEESTHDGSDGPSRRTDPGRVTDDEPDSMRVFAGDDSFEIVRRSD